MNDFKNQVAYDLTLEYIRQNNMMKVSSEKTLENRIEDFRKIYDEIYKCLCK
ncbi:hypothetical protein [uncultured Eubacterium sp.]|uniref:hypothetical protein n=1 Tax=uncultured Eubacterium sp. TaxID=165185 RepID=UPI0025939160|nr:hypothetical protein [uncultured Eubacterium sp.]